MYFLAEDNSHEYVYNETNLFNNTKIFPEGTTIVRFCASGDIKHESIPVGFLAHLAMHMELYKIEEKSMQVLTL